MKTFNKIAIASTLLALTSGVYANSIDQDSATVSMNVGLFASLTGLDNFTLTTSDTDGAAGAVYSGSDSFNLESNGQVRVTLAGGDLSNGADSVSTAYAMDDSGTTFDTVADSVHNASHTVSASATLGNISSQKAGAYSSEITITVSAI
jgi:hypothetical protein